MLGLNSRLNSTVFQVDHKNNLMILTAKSIDHPSYPVTSEYVRVAKYRSQMFIRPHKSFDEKGFDYVMSYFDDPQLYVPYWAVNKMTISSMFFFLCSMKGEHVVAALSV